MKDEILLSEKHGVNPSLEVCALCGESISVVLFGKLPNDEEAPKEVCLGHVCEKCINELKENKKRVFFKVLDSGKIGEEYITIKDEYLTPEGLKEFGDNVIIYFNEETFNNLLGKC